MPEPVKPSDFAPPVAEANREFVLSRIRCWGCLLGQHEGGQHPWISDPEDGEWLRALNARLRELGMEPIPEGTNQCHCPCVTDPSYVDYPTPDFGPPDMDIGSLTPTPCPVCGEERACGYDSEGRPFIHALWDRDGDEPEDGDDDG